MKLISPSHEIWEQDTSGKPLHSSATSAETMQESLLHGIYAQIERAGRVCYKSEDKITNDSAKAFVDRLIESKHYAMLEHGTVYLKVHFESKQELFKSDILDRYDHNAYSKWQRGLVLSEGTLQKEVVKGENLLITTNYRVIVENGWQKDLDYLCIPSFFHVPRITVHLTTCRTVTHELVRHRHMSFAQESTRYCNYMKGKFGSELTFIRPNWLATEPVLLEDPKYAESKREFLGCLENIESTYCTLISNGWKPQQAATILPNALKAEIVVTGFIDDWKHVFDLRVKGTTGAPHPQMKEVMEPVWKEFVKRKYIQQ